MAKELWLQDVLYEDLISSLCATMAAWHGVGYTTHDAEEDEKSFRAYYPDVLRKDLEETDNLALILYRGSMLRILFGDDT